MKIDRVADLLTSVNKTFGIDDVDLIIIGQVERERKAGNKITIMGFVDNFNRTSPASTHRRIKSLCAKKLLEKVDSEDSGRVKFLATGKKFTDLHAHLMES
jgi:hypothetical protein